MTVPARLLGQDVHAVEDLTRPWTTDVRTSRVTLDDGLVIVHQAGLPTAAGRAGIARRMRLGGVLRAAAPGLPVPRVLDGDAAANPPFLLTEYVAGRTGGELLRSAASAAVLGRIAGEVARAISAIPPRALGRGVARRWADGERLGAVAVRWAAEAAPLLGAPEAAAVRAVVARVPGLFEGGGAVAAVTAHGDLAPVNLVISRARLVGVLDPERLRVAPSGFDAACFRLLVRHHHPERWRDVGPVFLAAAGLADSDRSMARLDDLAVLACLEQLAGLPHRSKARAAWAARAVEVLRGELPGP